MVDFNPVNALIMTSTTIQPALPPQPSKNLWGDQIRMSSLNTSYG